MFRKLLLCSAVLAAMTAAAVAADLPNTKGSPAYVPPPVISWTGFYVGVNAGGAWGKLDPQTSTTAGSYFLASDVREIDAIGQPSGQASGFTGGGQIGYNLQFANNFVAGIEGDFDYLHLRAGNSSGSIYSCCAPSSFNVSTSSSTDWLSTLRARVGFLAMPNLLIYATGGLALSEARSSFLFTDDYLGGASASGQLSDTRVGWTVGGGAEYALTQNWSIKAEYLYADLGRRSTTGFVTSNFFGPAPTSVLTQSVDPKVNIARVGINYKFDFLAPPVAKY